MKVQPMIIDVRTEAGQTMLMFLQKRNIKMADRVKTQIEQNSFLLINGFEDIWYWPIDLVRGLQGTVLEQIFNFY